LSDTFIEENLYRYVMKSFFIAVVLPLVFTCSSAQALDIAGSEEGKLIHDANSALTGRDYITAFAKFSILAERGNASAQFNLGAFYLNGQGVQKDIKQAFEWFQKSALLGNERARKIVENAAAQGNMYAKDALKKIQELEMPALTPAAAPAPVQVSALVPVRSQPQAPEKKSDKVAGEKFNYRMPSVPTRNEWTFGISADYLNNKVTEALPYSFGGVTYTTTQSYSLTEPGASVLVGYDDLSVITSYKSGHGSVNANVQGAGTISKSFQAKELVVDVRWLLRNLSSSNLMPYVQLGYARKSNDGTANELEFQDAYSQNDSVLFMGAGAILPVNENIGFQVDARIGSDKQKHYDSYTANPGVILSLNSYNYSSSAAFTSVAASVYYYMYGGWNAQLVAKLERYPDGAGAAVRTTGIGATLGYAY
jgi:TPR repeat protein